MTSGISVLLAIMYSLPPFKHGPTAPNSVTELRYFKFSGAAIVAAPRYHVLVGLGQIWNVVWSM